MSHSKKTKKDFSLYIEKWNPSAKKFINTCAICNSKGYNPSIEEEGFIHPSSETTDTIHLAIYEELTATLKPLSLDEFGRCEDCAKIMDNK